MTERPGGHDISPGDAWTSTHERAHTLLAERLYEPLDPERAEWLDGHLAGCQECRQVDTEYRVGREALKALLPPVPPRDLWARTSAALDRTDRRARWSWPLPVASVGGLGRGRGPLAGAIVAVVVVAFVASSVLSPGKPSSIVLGDRSPGRPSGAAPATPIAVPGGDVTWITSTGDGSYVLNHSAVGQVCPTTATTPCATIDPKVGSVALVSVSPRSIYASPARDQVVVLGRKSGSAGLTMYVMSVAAGPRPSGQPGATPSPSSSAADGTPSSVPNQSVTPKPPTPTPTPTIEVTPPPSAPIQTPTVSPSASPPPGSSEKPGSSGGPTASIIPGETPSPTSAAVLAIASELVVVGQTAAYSPDGAWFAFTARRAAATSGSDIYLWRAGELMAQPVTTDGRSVFSGWVGARLVGSRVDQPSVEPTPAPSDGTGSSAPSATSSALPPDVLASDATGTAGPSQPPSLELMPTAFLLDPATGLVVQLAAPAWRPVVDPSRSIVVYWDGSVVIDPATGGWTGATGRLVLSSWPALAGVAALAVGPVTAVESAAPLTSADSAGSSAVPSPTVSPSARPSTSSSPAQDAASPGGSASPASAAAAFELPADVGSATGLAWDAGWDETGQHLAIWIGDPAVPASGRISLLTIDPTTHQVVASGPSLSANPALPGFSLSDGHLAWATPPDASGSGSRLQVFAWLGPDAGKIDSRPASATDTVIVVQH